jgi:hypothetical protein
MGRNGVEAFKKPRTPEAKTKRRPVYADTPHRRHAPSPTRRHVSPPARRAELRELQLIQSVPGQTNGREVSPDQITIATLKNAEPVLVQEMKDLPWQYVIALENLRPDFEIDHLDRTATECFGETSQTVQFVTFQIHLEKSHPIGPLTLQAIVQQDILLDRRTIRIDMRVSGELRIELKTGGPSVIADTAFDHLDGSRRKQAFRLFQVTNQVRIRLEPPNRFPGFRE